MGDGRGCARLTRLLDGFGDVEGRDRVAKILKSNEGRKRAMADVAELEEGKINRWLGVFALFIPSIGSSTRRED